MNNSKFLDETGLAHLMSKLKTEFGKKASLGDDGKVSSDQLPSYVDDVVEFSGMVEGITITLGSTESSGFVVYDKTSKSFVLAVQDGLSSKISYFINWPSRDDYQSESGDTVTPYTGKIFVDTSTNKAYRWSGSDLIEITSGGVSLGETSTTAYAGDKGAQNAKDIAAIKSGDLPLVSPMILSVNTNTYFWEISDQDDTSISKMATLALNTIYGYKVKFIGCMKWVHTDGYKDPTAMNGGSWSSSTLPSSGTASDTLTISDIIADKTITASIKAPKQGLVLSNGIIKEASSSDYDTASVSASVHFQYKVVAATTESAVDANALQNFLDSSSDDYAATLQNGRNVVRTNVTTGEKEYFVYAYPTVLGDLTKITMNDATPLLADGFTKSEVTVTDPQTKASIKYNVYVSVQRGAFSGAKLDIA